MDREALDEKEAAIGFPRRRGDGPASRMSGCTVPRFPPQARGWTLFFESREKAVSVSPAGAGMDPSARRQQASKTSFPRRRGDGPQVASRFGVSKRFPPQARGWTFGEPPRRVRQLVSPAGAGMDPPIDIPGTARRSFPRRRGDGPPLMLKPPRSKRFPPQARGWTLSPRPWPASPFVSPAGAGMDLSP